MPRMNIKPVVRRFTSPAARYEARFVNGIWTIFDRVNFGHGQPVSLRKDALRIAAELNEGKLKWAA